MVLPVGVVIELTLAALLFSLLGWRKTSRLLLGVAVLVLWACSTQIVADALLGRAEQDYPAVTLDRVPAGRCIVLLGGAVEPAWPPRADLELSDSVDRVRKAAQLYREGKGSLIIASGGRQPWSVTEETEANSMRILLLEWGVEESAIVLENNSRNTRENAVNTQPLLEQFDCGKSLLVTSAAHMKRARATFRKLGADVFPVTTDVRVYAQPRNKLMDFLPNADALQMTTDAMREWVGWTIYRIRGWV